VKKQSCTPEVTSNVSNTRSRRKERNRYEQDGHRSIEYIRIWKSVQKSQQEATKKRHEDTEKGEALNLSSHSSLLKLFASRVSYSGSLLLLGKSHRNFRQIATSCWILSTSLENLVKTSTGRLQSKRSFQRFLLWNCSIFLFSESVWRESELSTVAGPDLPNVQYLTNINPISSKFIVTAPTDRDGHGIWPWGRNGCCSSF